MTSPQYIHWWIYGELFRVKTSASIVRKSLSFAIKGAPYLIARNVLFNSKMSLKMKTGKLRLK